MTTTKVSTNKEFENFKENNLKFLKLSEEQLKNKYDKVGTIICDCQHNIDCKKCGGDGHCLNCISYGEDHHKHMCANWLQRNYHNTESFIYIDI